MPFLLSALSWSSILREMCLPKKKSSGEIKWVKMYPITCTCNPTAQPWKSVLFAHFLVLQNEIHLFDFWYDIYAKYSIWAEWGIQEIWVKGKKRRQKYSSTLHGLKWLTGKSLCSSCWSLVYIVTLAQCSEFWIYSVSVFQAVWNAAVALEIQIDYY